MGTEIEEIKSKLNIVDVLGEYIRLEKAGINFKAVCPFHNEKTPSFIVSEERQMWHCFGCQKGGDVFSFVMEMERIEFKEALKILAEKAGVEIKTFNYQKNRNKDKTLEILERTTVFWEKNLWNEPEGEKVLDYLKKRGLKNEIIKKFRLGYAPDGWRNTLDFLVRNGYKTEEIAHSGILVKKEREEKARNDLNYYDRFRNRIIFPIADFSGRVVGFSARVTPGQDESQAKYINTPETDFYHKSRILYGLNNAKNQIRKRDWVLLVEGNMDVIACHQAGIENTVAVSGTALTQEQVDLIKRYTNNLKMFFDMDKAGESATQKSSKLCFKQEMNVKIVTLPSGKDAADLAKESPVELKKAIAQSLEAMEYFFQKSFLKFDKNEAIGKKKIAQYFLEFISYLENDVEKNHWLKKMSEALNVSEVALTDTFKKVSLEEKINEKKDIVQNNRPDTIFSKQENLLNDLIGIMLAFPLAWEKGLEKVEQNDFSFLESDPLFLIMKEKGKSCCFSFDSFIKFLKEKKQIRERAERVFFEKKFQLDLNNNWAELDSFDSLAELENILKELRKENLKRKLTQLTYDLKLAEKRGEKEVSLILRKETGKISEELAKIIG